MVRDYTSIMNISEEVLLCSISFFVLLTFFSVHERSELIMKVFCPYCNSEAKLVDNGWDLF